MKNRILSLVLLTMSSLSYTTHARQADSFLPVIPTPREAVSFEGAFRINSQTRIIMGKGCTAEDRFATDQINEHLIRLGLPALAVTEEARIRSRASTTILLGPPNGPFAAAALRAQKTTLTDEMKKEGYLLAAGTDGISILAESARGRFYGVMTLLQLINSEKRSASVPRVLIRDWPLQPMRGITDDLSRGQVSTMENFKKIIRFLAKYKLNIYSPYIEDIFVFKNHPLIGKGRGALAPAEIRELDDYAKRFHVELIPIFETLGHWENILLLPEYAGYAEFPGAHTLNVSDERVYDLLDEMIGELADVFSSPWFNMAADESWDVGLGASRGRVEASDLATVHAEHYKRLFTILARHDKRPMMYGDIILNHPSILEKIPKDVVIVDWQYWGGREYPSAEVFRNAGFPFVVSPAIWNFTGPFPHYMNTIINVRNFARDGYENGALGILTSNWNDYGGEALRELNYYGFAWTAECAWQPLDADPVRFDEKFFPQFFGANEAGRLARQAYLFLGNPYALMEWHDLWRHPLLPPRAPSVRPLWRLQTIESTMPVATDLIRTAASLAKANKDHFRPLEFVANLYLWFAKKEDTRDMIAALQRDSTLDVQERDSRISEATEPVIADLQILKREFADLWLRTNREDNLHLLLDRYDRQVSYWKEIAQTPLVSDPVIPSSWLYHPGGNPGRRDSTATQVPRAFFRFEFNRDDSISPAGIQLLADTYAKAFVNGTELGEISARRSLSLIVEHGRVRQWDITKLLRPGQNVIAIEAANFNQFGSAGINLLGYHATPAGEYRILVVDSLVKTSDNAPEGWKQPGFDDSQWRFTAPKEYPGIVIAPNFRTGRLSWIER